MAIIHEIEKADLSVKTGEPGLYEFEASEGNANHPFPAIVAVTIVSESTLIDSTIAGPDTATDLATWQTSHSTVHIFLSELGSRDAALARLGPALAELRVQEGLHARVVRGAWLHALTASGAWLYARARAVAGQGAGEEAAVALVVPLEVRVATRVLRFWCAACSERMRAARRLMAWVPRWPAGREGESCPVCLEDLGSGGGGTVARTPCGHMFHGVCLLKWLTDSDSCPVCRFDILELEYPKES